MELPKAISAILFYQAEPMTIKRLADLLKHSEGEVREALIRLEESLEKGGLRLLQNGDEVTLGTMPEASAWIEAMTKEELSRDLSRASLETLSIILYKGPVVRSEIDYIRGVNSTFILRNLLIRGLVERVDNPADKRSFLYKPTFQLLEYMGVSGVGDLPEYEETVMKLAQFIKTKEGENHIETEEQKNGGAEVDAIHEDEEGVNVAEENEAGKNFDDTELIQHRDEGHIRT